MKFLMPSDEQFDYIVDQSDDPFIILRYLWEDGMAKGIFIGFVIGIVVGLVVR